MVQVVLWTVAGADACRGLQELEHDGLTLQPGLFVLHVEKVPGVVDSGELAVTQVLSKQAHVIRRGVFVVLAVDKQQRDVDGRQAFHLAVVVHMYHLVDVRVQLQVLVAVEAADMAMVVALEQGG